MHSKLTKFLCLQLQFIPDLSRFLSTNRQQTELLKKSSAASISGWFRHVVGYRRLDDATLAVEKFPKNVLKIWWVQPTYGLYVTEFMSVLVFFYSFVLCTVYLLRRRL